jgi:hypothetical protein
MNRSLLSLFYGSGLSLCVWILLPGSVHALGSGIVGVSGAVVVELPPISLSRDAFESNTQISLIEERTAVTLPSPVSVDSDGTPKTYSFEADRTPGALSTGTVANVFLLHLDPIGFPQPALRLSGTVTFANRILGMAYSQNFLDQSDFLGAPGTMYPLGVDAVYRQFEYGPPGISVYDSATISPDGHTLTVSWGVTQYYDQLRVFTNVPEPAGLASAGILCLGAPVLRLFSRRR